MILLQIFLIVKNWFVPFVEIVFVISNTDSITHEACVTISNAVTRFSVGQRPGEEAVEAIIFPWLTLYTTPTLIIYPWAHCQ